MLNLREDTRERQTHADGVLSSQDLGVGFVVDRYSSRSPMSESAIHFAEHFSSHTRRDKQVDHQQRLGKCIDEALGSNL